MAVIGGGLGGLCLAIQGAKAGFKVVLFEKQQYPFHKVCGEYISMESWPFLKSLGLDLDNMNLPIIKKLKVSAPNGNVLVQDLPLGGFGISRYALDYELSKIAKYTGVTLLEQTSVQDVLWQHDQFTIKTNEAEFNAKLCFGSFGKKSNLDVKWQRPFALAKANKENNYIGVKYHIKLDIPTDTIFLHNFENGYCGMSMIESGKACLCYLTTAKNLAKGGGIAAMEKDVLGKNQHLEYIMTHAVQLYEQPLTISQVSFAPKKQIEGGIVMLGDAAGLISPLCGNGMSMAMHASKLAFECASLFLSNQIDRASFLQSYQQKWKQNFAKRLKAGRIIQALFGKKTTTNFLIFALKRMPWLTRKMIALTHGQPF